MYVCVYDVLFQCSWDSLRIHHFPNHDKVVTEDELVTMLQIAMLKAIVQPFEWTYSYPKCLVSEVYFFSLA